LMDLPEENTLLLDARNIRKFFAAGGGAVIRAVDNVSFSVRAGQTLGVVGESGCGKSTVARAIMNLVPLDGGDVLFAGAKIGSTALPLRRFRRQAQMVFQDSHASLNPRLSVVDSVAFGPRAHGMGRRNAIDRARQTLDLVGLDPARFANAFPHELSGGQRQRVNIARALVIDPCLVVFDEAVSALDKTVEAQVLTLIGALKRKLSLTYVFISHDLNVINFLSDRVMVMYLGKIVEIGSVVDVYDDTRHPYTKALLSSRPTFDPASRTMAAPLAGDPPSPMNPPSGCRFRTRCPIAQAICAEREPALIPMAGREGHSAACHFAGVIDSRILGQELAHAAS
jgi:peptide/nickel transport system ATP-binding protein